MVDHVAAMKRIADMRAIEARMTIVVLQHKDDCEIRRTALKVIRDAQVAADLTAQTAWGTDAAR